MGKHESPIRWEENERFQRGNARVLSIAFVFLVGSCGGLSLWQRDWALLMQLVQVVGAVITGLGCWSVGVWFVSRAIELTANRGHKNPD